jgi:hypothetical protein
MDKLNNDFFADTPKEFPDSFKLVFGPDVFILGIQYGDSGDALALTPAHAKRLAAHMAHAVANYEKAHGAIQGGEWNPNTPSPIQISPDQGNNGPSR